MHWNYIAYDKHRCVMRIVIKLLMISIVMPCIGFKLLMISIVVQYIGV